MCCEQGYQHRQRRLLDFREEARATPPSTRSSPWRSRLRFSTTWGPAGRRVRPARRRVRGRPGQRLHQPRPLPAAHIHRNLGPRPALPRTGMVPLVRRLDRTHLRLPLLEHGGRDPQQLAQAPLRAGRHGRRDPVQILALAVLFLGKRHVGTTGGLFLSQLAEGLVRRDDLWLDGIPVPRVLLPRECPDLVR